MGNSPHTPAAGDAVVPYRVDPSQGCWVASVFVGEYGGRFCVNGRCCGAGRGEFFAASLSFLLVCIPSPRAQIRASGSPTESLNPEENVFPQPKEAAPQVIPHSDTAVAGGNPLGETLGSCPLLVKPIAWPHNFRIKQAEPSVLRGGCLSKLPDFWLISPDHQKRARPRLCPPLAGV